MSKSILLKLANIVDMEMDGCCVHPSEYFDLKEILNEIYGEEKVSQVLNHYKSIKHQIEEKSNDDYSYYYNVIDINTLEIIEGEEKATTERIPLVWLKTL
jgi:hypothetical protein